MKMMIKLQIDELVNKIVHHNSTEYEIGYSLEHTDETWRYLYGCSMLYTDGAPIDSLIKWLYKFDESDILVMSRTSYLMIEGIIVYLIS